MCFRELYESLTEYKGRNLYTDVLVPFLPKAQKKVKSLSYLSKLETSSPENIKIEDLWELFALNVCNDFLLLPLNVSRGEYLSFFTELGFEEIKPGKKFNPIIHEIVDVANWPEQDEGISIGSCYWPGLQFGDLIFSRCAVDIYCNESWGIIEGIANQSKLYFINYRTRRETEDESHGWGSNSRWRTQFSRNYFIKKRAFFNVDGDVDLYLNIGDTELNPLPIESARELLVNKCFVRSKLTNDDYYPYIWKLVVENIEGVWPNLNENIVPFETALNKVCS